MPVPDARIKFYASCKRLFELFAIDWAWAGVLKVMAKVGARLPILLSGISSIFGVRARLAFLVLILMVPLMLDRVWVLEDRRKQQIKAVSAEITELAKRGAVQQNAVIS